MNPTDEALIARVRELLAPLGDISVRRMFGGHGVYRGELIIALLAEGRLWLKVDQDTRAQFEAAGATVYTSQGKGRPIAMSYWSAPTAALESAAALQPWAELALAAATRSADSKRDLPTRPTYPGTRKAKRAE